MLRDRDMVRCGGFTFQVQISVLPQPASRHRPKKSLKQKAKAEPEEMPVQDLDTYLQILQNHRDIPFTRLTRTGVMRFLTETGKSNDLMVHTDEPGKLQEAARYWDRHAAATVSRRFAGLLGVMSMFLCGGYDQKSSVFRAIVADGDKNDVEARLKEAGFGSSLIGVEEMRFEQPAFLQQWLFFGGLAELLAIHGHTFDADDLLLTSDTDAKIISTTSLNSLAEMLIATPRVPAEASSSTRNCIAKICQVIYDETYRGRKLDTSGTDLVRIGEKIHLSIRTFLRSTILLLDHYGLDDVAADIDQKIFSPPALMASLNAETTEENGICQSMLEILRAENVLDADAIFFAISVGPDMGPKKNHSICSKFSCSAYNVEEEQYQIKHTRPGCNCSFMSIEVSKVCQALTSNYIPAIQIRVIDDDGDLELDVISNCTYIAISHVSLANRCNSGLMA
ncbi:hypothetical protein K440DRAFT_644479 [Wilcoxina mikolae CBS 423.85]|nr:hypothetical protein K440DRAFT_644479 [Wilcoxina mikolae CBS 423.85]